MGTVGICSIVYFSSGLSRTAVVKWVSVSVTTYTTNRNRINQGNIPSAATNVDVDLTVPDASFIV
eukprot:scaffold53972_cov63-Cyclotella_meneghiniana.AAC.5